MIFLEGANLRGATPSQAEASRLAEQLSSAVRSEQTAALKKMEASVKSDPVAAAGLLGGEWGEALLRTRRYTELRVWSQRAITMTPSNTKLVQKLQSNRAYAFLYAGAWEKALFSAKGAYNVATIDDTESAIELVVACLRDARRDRPELVDEFKREQAAGAEPRGADRNTDAPAGKTPVLKSIAIPDERFRRWVPDEVPKDYRGLVGRGNLLLLADEPAEARKCFETAFQIADDKDISEATENLARVMKAEDGTTGRAVAWLKTQSSKPSK